ncbi:hypothetical protein JQX13_15800 [Archangium violaceum]|uniref:hypothetical protein n=1 Tax=Archangium violaceum TaxID=83451 RepID=UPI00193B3F9D|nr:hypothetical protein [Archangium violaceum]QRK11401.1 hypothetical protein JQX13_15800 [Archangium violaceum]
MRLRTTLLLGLLTGCATTASTSKTEAPAEGAPAAQPASTSEPRADLEALSTRELAPLAKQQVSAPDGSFTAEVEAEAAPTFQEQQGVLVLSVPLGTRSPMTCFVYSEPLDAGGAIYRLLQMAGQRTDIQRARTTDVRLIGDSPAVFAEALYLTDTPRGKAAGLAKMMVYTHDQVPLVCTHDEMGYSESFQRISSGLAGSLKSAAERPQAPRYFEFSVIRVEGHPVGFEKRVTRDASGGGRLTELEVSFLFPRSQKEMTVQDTVSTELSDKDGRLVARDHARATNGELDIQMSLEQVKGREYHYEGKHNGRDLSGNFTAPDELLGELGSSRVVREQLLSGKKKELTLQVYSPSASPAAPIPQVLRKEAGARELTAEIGALKMTLSVDAQGMAEKVTIPMGSMQMVQERVSVSGTP